MNTNEQFVADALFELVQIRLDDLGVDLESIVENDLFCDQQNLFSPLSEVSEKTIQLLEESARRGNEDAAFVLGVILALGLRPCDQTWDPRPLWKQAANAGHPLACFCLGYSYLYGQLGLDESRAEALRWLIASAEAGYLHAQWFLGNLYDQGDVGGSGGRDPALAAYWYQRAAERGDAESQFALGELFEAGRGVEQDYEAANLWYRQAADQGIYAAQYALGRMAESGRGQPQDFDEAARWFELVARRSDDFEPVSGQARYHFGWFLEMGYLGDDRCDEAFDWYRRAAKAGNPEATQRLFEVWEHGELRDAPGDEPTKWCEACAKNGDRDAAYRLGMINLESDPPDLNMALHWFSSAASQGHPEAVIQQANVSARLELRNEDAD